jgi:hypothetical protein
MMPQFDWQLIVVILTLAGAALYLARRGMKTFRSSRQGASGGGSCGSCGSCNSSEKVAGNSTTGFVPLEDLMSDKPRSSR